VANDGDDQPTAVDAETPGRDTAVEHHDDGRGVVTLAHDRRTGGDPMQRGRLGQAGTRLGPEMGKAW
jgi:hypothetical protein